MPGSHLVRVGAMAQVGRFAAVDTAMYPRGTRVIVRTVRGLEIGEVLSPPRDGAESTQPDGPILRGMTVEDQLLEARLVKNQHAAFDACQGRLRELNLRASLMDVEHLFDGRSLYFYFLGETSPEIDRITQELAEVYEAKAQFRAFAETVVNGCGPGCGTESAAGGGCTSCATGCGVAGACATHRH